MSDNNEYGLESSDYSWDDERLELRNTETAEQVYEELEDRRAEQMAGQGILGDTVGGNWYELNKDDSYIEIAANGSGEQRKARRLVNEILDELER